MKDFLQPMSRDIDFSSITNYNTLVQNGLIDTTQMRKIFQAEEVAPNTIAQFLETIGNRFPVHNMKNRHWEEGAYWGTFHSTFAVTDPGVGNTITVTLMPEDHQQGYSFPDMTDTVIMPNMVEGHIYRKDTTNPSAHVLYVEPADHTKDLGAIPSGQEIAVWSNTYAEGTGHQKGKEQFPIARDCQLQIFKEKTKTTGTALSAKIYPYMVNDGIESVWSWETVKAQVRIMRRQSNAYLVSDKNYGLYTSAFEAANYLGGAGVNKEKYKTMGWYNWTNLLGGELSITPGNESMADFDAIINYFEYAGCFPTVVTIPMGRARIANYTQKVLKGYVDLGHAHDYINYENFLGEPLNLRREQVQGLHAFFDITSFTYGGVKWNLWNAPELGSSKGLGLSGYDGQNMMFIMPLEALTDPVLKGQNGTKEKYPNVGIMYEVQDDGFSRGFERWNLGGAGGGYPYTSELDIKEELMRAVTGFWGAKMHHGMIGHS